MTMSVQEKPKALTTATAPVQNITSSAKVADKYAPYWEDDQTMNPIIVKGIMVEGDFVWVRLPNGDVKWVHCHTLGTFRAA